MGLSLNLFCLILNWFLGTWGACLRLERGID